MAPRFTIVTDDTSDKTYIPGDRVSGKVILDVPRALKRKAVMLSFLGESRYVYYTGSGNGQQVHVVGIPFFKFDHTLHPGPVNLANEKRVWTFDFKFPKEFTPFYAQDSVLPLPSSTHHSIIFDTFRPLAGIVYYLHAHCPRGRAPIISFQGSLCKPYGLQHLQFEHPARQPPGAPEIQVVTLKGQHRNSSKLPSSIHAFGEKFRDGRPNWETHTPCIQFVPKIHAPKGTTPDQQIPLSLAIELRHGKNASDSQIRPRLVIETVSIYVANSWVHGRRKKGDRLVHRGALQTDVPLDGTPVSLVEQFKLQDAEPSFAFPVGWGSLTREYHLTVILRLRYLDKTFKIKSKSKEIPIEVGPRYDPRMANLPADLQPAPPTELPDHRILGALPLDVLKVEKRKRRAARKARVRKMFVRDAA